MKFIDLRSDTVTLQTKNMKDAMYNASVGDDVYHDDEAVNELEEYAAKISGKEAALFVPSGTFANQLCILTHTSKGSEVILGDDSHIIQHEVGAAGVISGVQFRTINSNNGIIPPEEIEAKIRKISDIHYPNTKLICLENAHSNGRVIPIDIMKRTFNMASEYDIPVHLDGARVFNAATYLNIDVIDILKYTHSAMFCLSKGLAAPFGSMVVGDRNFIDDARKNRKLLGGGLRQIGYLAAAGLVALKEMIPNLKTDNEKAVYLAKELQKLDGVEIDIDSVHINLVFFRISLNKSLCKMENFLYERNIKINDHEEGLYRVVTHHGISYEDIDFYIQSLKDFLYK